MINSVKSLPNFESFILKSPTKILINTYKRGEKKGKENWFYLNLNSYRNAHYFILNNSKILFKELMSSQINNLPNLGEGYINIKYTLYPSSKKLSDVSNICSIVDKYFCDALVQSGKLPDDNYKYITTVIYAFGKVDKNNPRVEIEIRKKIC